MKADLEMLEEDPDTMQWAKRLKESRELVLKYNQQSIENEKKCAEREAEVAAAEMKLEAAICERDEANAEVAMVREAMMMDTTCLEDAVADTLMKKEAELLEAKAKCEKNEKREYNLRVALDSVTGTAIAIQEQLEAYNRALAASTKASDVDKMVEALAAQLKTATEQQHTEKQVLEETKEKHHAEVDALQATIKSLKEQVAKMGSELKQRTDMQEMLKQVAEERNQAEEKAKAMSDFVKEQQVKDKISLIAEGRRVADTRMEKLEETFLHKYGERSKIRSDIALLGGEAIEVASAAENRDGSTTLNPAAVEESLKVQDLNTKLRQDNRQLVMVTKKLGRSLNEKERIITKAEESITALEQKMKDLQASLHKAEVTAAKAQTDAVAAESAAKVAVTRNLGVTEGAVTIDAVLAQTVATDGSGSSSGVVSESNAEARLKRVVKELQTERNSIKAKLEGEVKALRDNKVKKIVELENEMSQVVGLWESEKQQFKLILQIQKDAMEKTIGIKVKDLEAAEARTITAQAESNQNIQKAQELQKKIIELEAAAKDTALLELQVVELQRLIAEQEEQIESLEIDADAMTIQIATVQGKLVNATSESKSHQMDLDNLNVPALKKMIAGLNDEAETMKSELKQIGELKDRLERKTLDHAQKCDDYDKQTIVVLEQEEKITELQTERESIIKALKDENEVALDKLRQEDAVLIKEVEKDSTNVFEALKDEVLKAQRDVAQAEKDKEEAMQELEVEREEIKQAADEKIEEHKKEVEIQKRNMEEENAAKQAEITQEQGAVEAEKKKLEEEKVKFDEDKGQAWIDLVALSALDRDVIYEESRLDVEAKREEIDKEQIALRAELDEIIAQKNETIKETETALGEERAFCTTKFSGHEFAWAAYIMIRELKGSYVDSMKKNHATYRIELVRSECEAALQLEREKIVHLEKAAEEADGEATEEMEALEKENEENLAGFDKKLAIKDEEIEQIKRDCQQDMINFKQTQADDFANLQRENDQLMKESTFAAKKLGETKAMAIANDEELQQLRSAKEVGDIVKNDPTGSEDSIISELSSRIGKMNIDINRLTRLSEYKEESIESLQMEVEKIADEADLLQDQLDVNKSECEDLQRRITKLETESASMVAAHETEVTDLNQAKERVDKKLKKLQDENAEINGAMEQIEATKAVLKTLLGEEQDEAVSADDIGGLTAKINQKVSDLQVVISDLKTDKESLQTGIQKAEDAKKDGLTAHADLQKTHEEFKAMKQAEAEAAKLGNTYKIVEAFKAEVLAAVGNKSMVVDNIDSEKLEKALAKAEAKNGNLDEVDEETLIAIGTRLRVKLPGMVKANRVELEMSNYEELVNLAKIKKTADGLQAKILEEDQDAVYFGDLLPKEPIRTAELEELLNQNKDNDPFRLENMEKANLEMQETIADLEKKLAKAKKDAKNQKEIAANMDSYNEDVKLKQKGLMEENSALLNKEFGDTGGIIKELREEVSMYQTITIDFEQEVKTLKQQNQEKDSAIHGLETKVNIMTEKERTFLVDEAKMFNQLFKDVKHLKDENEVRIKVSRQTVDMQRRVALLKEGVECLKLPVTMQDLVTDLKASQMEETHKEAITLETRFKDALAARQAVLEALPALNITLDKITKLPAGLNYLKFDAVNHIEANLVQLGFQDIEPFGEKTVRNMCQKLDTKDEVVLECTGFLYKFAASVRKELSADDADELVEVAPEIREFLLGIPAQHKEVRREALDLLDQSVQLLEGKRSQMSMQEIVKRLQEAGRNEDSSRLEEAIPKLAAALESRKVLDENITIGNNLCQMLKELPPSLRTTRKGGLRIVRKMISRFTDASSQNDLNVDSLIQCFKDSDNVKNADVLEKLSADTTNVENTEKTTLDVEAIDESIAVGRVLLLDIERYPPDDELFMRNGPEVVSNLISRLQAAKESAPAPVEAKYRSALIEQQDTSSSIILKLQEQISEYETKWKASEPIRTEFDKLKTAMEDQLADKNRELVKNRALLAELQDLEKLRADNQKLEDDIVQLTKTANARRAPSTADLDMPGGEPPSTEPTTALVAVQEETKTIEVSDGVMEPFNMLLIQKSMTDLEMALDESRLEAITAQTELAAVYEELVQQGSASDMLVAAFRGLEAQLLQSVSDIKATQRDLEAAQSENKRMQAELNNADNKLNDAGKKALETVKTEMAETKMVVADAKVSNMAERALLKDEVKKLRRQLHSACMKFRADRHTFEIREMEAVNALEHYKEEFEHKVNELESAIDALQTHLQATITQANMDRMTYDENMTTISSQQSSVAAKFEKEISDLKGENCALVIKAEEKEDELLQKIEEAKLNASGKMKEKIAAMELGWSQERNELMRHVSILEEQIDLIEKGTDSAMNGLIMQKIEQVEIIHAKELEIQSLKDLRNDMTNQCEELETMVKVIGEKCLEITNAVAGVEETNHGLTKEKDTALRRIEALEAALADCKTRAGNAIGNILKRGKKQQEDLVAVREELEKVKQEALVAQEALGGAKRAALDSSNEVAELSLLHQKLADQKEELSQQHTMLQAANAESKALSMTVDKAKTTLKAQAKQLEVANEMADKLTKENKELRKNQKEKTMAVNGDTGSPVLSDVESDGELADFYNDLDLDVDIGDLHLDKPLSDLDD